MSTVRTRESLPTVEQIVSLPAVVATTAPKPWEDQNGHVNVLAYYEFHMTAAEAALASMGIDDGYLRRHGESVFSVEHHISFFNEALVGHDVSTHFLVIDRTEKLMHAVSILVNRTTRRVANALELVEVHVDLTTRRACPFQPGVAARIDELLEEHRQLGWEFPLSGSMGLRSGARA